MLDQTVSTNHYQPFEAADRSDRRSHPVMKSYRYMTVAEVAALRPGSHVNVIDPNGRRAQVKITSVKTWKTRPDVQVGWKFGLYEHGRELFTQPDDNFFFIVEC